MPRQTHALPLPTAALQRELRAAAAANAFDDDVFADSGDEAGAEPPTERPAWCRARRGSAPARLEGRAGGSQVGEEGAGATTGKREGRSGSW